MNKKAIKQLIEYYFDQQPLYKHLFDSYHQFIEEIIPYILSDKNYFYESIYNTDIYLHGFQCTNIRVKSSTFENDNELKFPSDARKNQLNYFCSIIADVQQYVEKIDTISNKKTIQLVGQQEKDLPIANVPVMVKSKYCSTYIKNDLKGECKYDPGGYFIVKGSEKVILSMEKMVDNKILIFHKKDSTYPNGIIYTAQINSKSNDWADNLQILTIKNRKDGVFVLSIATQLIDIPLFIFMRALGIESDLQILSYITFNLEDDQMINLLRPSIDNCVDDNNNTIRTKTEAINYLITKIRKHKRISQTNEEIASQQKIIQLTKILHNDLLPHLNEDIPKKIIFLGIMVNKLLNVILNREQVDDRDALHNKRIETPGILLSQLFRQNWKKLLNEIGKIFKRKNQSDETPINVISQLKPSTIELGFKTALSTGIWGINKTKRGVAQSLQRLSWIQGTSYLRRIISPSMDESTVKVTSIRQVNNNQCQLLCCLTGDTEITLSNGIDTELIKNISVDDNVLTVNPITLETSISGLYNKFSIISSELFQIVTISGRSIKVTGDHKLLINQNGKLIWKQACELNIKDKLIIKHVEKSVSQDFINVPLIILDELFIKNNKYAYILFSKGYINAIVPDQKIKILARLMGYIFSLRSTFTKVLNTSDEEYSLTVYFDSNKDLENFINDIYLLNLYNIKTKKTLLSLYCIVEFETAYLFYLLGAYVANIQGNSIIDVPEWILNASKMIKREFLSGLNGGCNNDVTYNKYNILILPSISYYINGQYVNMYKKYLKNVSNLLELLEVQTFVRIIEHSEINYTIELYYDQYVTNIINYCDYIGYRYNVYNKNLINKQVDFMKILLLQPFYTYKEYKSCFIENSVSVEIESIDLIENEDVYDFTTYSSNHSFIANGIVSSNCLETPEGAKIGIVKSLAMMASITMQNTSQIDIIKTILNKMKQVKHPFDINPLYMIRQVKIYINGNILGVCNIEDAYDVYMTLKKLRYENIIDKFTSISFNFSNKEIKLYCDGGRLYRPLLVVSDNKLNFTDEIRSYVLNKDHSKNKKSAWFNILSTYPYLIEYEDIESLNYLMVAENENQLEESKIASSRSIDLVDTTKINRYGDYRWVNYTHCDFHSWVMFGSVVSNIPFSNHNYPPRNIINFSQAKQAIGTYLTSYKDRMDTAAQILYHPHTPLVRTDAMKFNGCLDLPHGENAIIAICSYTGYNQDDSVIINQSAIDRGIFRADTFKKFFSEIKKNASTSQDDIFTKPDRNKVTSMKQGNYNKLNDKGYIPEETEVVNEDIIIGKISPIQPTGNNNKVYKDSSEIFKSNVNGIIDRVHTDIYNAEGYEMYSVRVRMERKPMVGDKFTCYDDSHEILTSIGWINVSKLTKDHFIATIIDDCLVYLNPLELQVYDYNDDIYVIDSNNISACITPNHRIYVSSDKLNYNIDTIENLKTSDWYYKKNITNYTGSHNSTYFIYDSTGNIIYVKRYIKNNNYELINIHKSILMLVNTIVENTDKSVYPIWIWDLPMKYCRIIVDIIITLYGTNVILETNSNEFQRLCLHAGYSCDIIDTNNNLYNSVTINTNENNTPIVSYDKINSAYHIGKVYCCTMPGIGLVYTRRNGKVMWCGNSNHGSKCSVGITYKQKDMPFTESGIIPDLIINPHGFPSRMSLGFIIEALTAKQASIEGNYIDGTPFNEYDIYQIPEILKSLGFSPYGTETMYCGLTGKKMETEIFIAPIFTIRLKHMVLDKVHGRSRGPKQALTRQPLEGRSRDGGLKIGEMEKDAMVAHGIGQFLKERTMEASDISKTYVCDDCGIIASKVIDKDYYKCKVCRNSTRISAVVIPYAFKLLVQELMAVNIFPRIRTGSISF